MNLVVNDDAKNRWVNLCQWNEPIKETNGDDTLHFHLGFEITLSDFLYLLKMSKMHCVQGSHIKMDKTNPLSISTLFLKYRVSLEFFSILKYQV